MKTGILDTERFSASLRRRGIDLENRRILVTHFQDSDQAKDFTVPPNCAGFGRIHHFHRTQPAPWPENPLPIDPAARALHLPPSNILRTQVFQNAICSWRCWYCFVDFELLSANTKFSEFRSADELLDLYLAETDRPGVIDLSGGQPDLVPEWGLWFARALSRRNMLSSVYLWSDDNLSNDYLWRYLQPDEIRELAGLPNYGRVGCFKGFDAESFSFNTKADPKLFAEQFTLMKRLVQAGFDVYGYVTLTTVVRQVWRRKWLSLWIGSNKCTRIFPSVLCRSGFRSLRRLRRGLDRTRRRRSISRNARSRLGTMSCVGDSIKRSCKKI